MNILLQTLIERDGLTENQAWHLAEEAALDFDAGAAPEKLLADVFGLEPDYVWDFFALVDDVAPFVIY